MTVGRRRARPATYRAHVQPANFGTWTPRGMALRPVHDGNLDSSPSAEREQKAGVMDGQVAIVTGGTGDIGRGVCRALTKAGATVVALDLDTSRAEGAARVLECDVTDPAACTAAVNQIVDEFGGVNTLVNLAQQFVVHTPLLEVTDDDMRRLVRLGPHRDAAND